MSRIRKSITIGKYYTMDEVRKILGLSKTHHFCREDYPEFYNESTLFKYKGKIRRLVSGDDIVMRLMFGHPKKVKSFRETKKHGHIEVTLK